MYRFLLSRRWAFITLFALLLIPAMIRLGFWQLHRHEARVARNELIARSLTAPPVAFDSLSPSPGFAVPGELTWRTVTASGQYDPAHEFVVRGRTEPGGSSIGYFVVTPLKLADGAGVVLVNRGWVDSAADATSYPPVPAPPAGQVTVTGRMRADETTASSGIRDRGGLPERQYKLINSGQQARESGERVLGGYLELAATDPTATGGPEALAEPDHSDIGPHMAYAVQWWLFCGLVPVGLVVLARREAAERAAEARKAAADPELVEA
ncbi:SURF1 family protein [Kitasatospora sp. NPDC094015]|uniref:SURF1 family cytochrome oxidase biogenesis protein n=1 Tax=Kitasatospora sp. NPDC094015 TaxID=3155205 RepID=UPI003318AEFD